MLAAITAKLRTQWSQANTKPCCLLCAALLTCCRHHSDRCAAIHINMCVAQPNFYNPLHILQGLNALLLPQLPLLLTSTEIQRVQVCACNLGRLLLKCAKNKSR
jgi:hypothetical protein